MTPEDFSAFADYCKEHYGWPQYELYKHCGWSKNMTTKYMREGAPLAVALACAAIAAGLKPWPETEVKR
ncbi:hypothetical protein SAMN06265338_11526 [Rhodoblastus acidophilus]|uniref:Transcriptional regulator n=1 Tax=Rhodoblastus acidophilus TaxID=1074 RepID=A0A212S7Q4_RHOAC|nr:hypothetical protein [Rhodoblastus acidophilus]RAI20364.1 hypothetical protein CH337_10215 [Rhodoblastus acidophilus]SNB81367.1 hypothetical protein SAMN06265338_11526 [Rhodoblastus acidophilus]